MLRQFQAYKGVIDEFIVDYLKRKARDLTKINLWGADLTEKLIPFITGGKTIRGSLVLFSFVSCGKTETSEALQCAVALELIHCGFLIHDDIMDQDYLRRGKPAMHTQYEREGSQRNARNPSHFGISMAINAADYCFFCAFDLLSKLPQANRTGLLAYIYQELSGVVVGQMQDVAGGHMSVRLTANDILATYRHKTARYTFALPMVSGAMLAGADANTLAHLETLGEAMGLLFQIRDDELSLSGNPEVTGKPAGSDAKNAKQTLASVLSTQELTNLQQKLVQKTHNALDALPFTSQSKKDLGELVIFCQEREN